MKLCIESSSQGEYLGAKPNALKSEAAAELGQRAHERLLGVLLENNEVSPGHCQATQQMLSGMAAQAVGADPGRYAYGLPCGSGKTQGVIALIAASYELKLGLTFAVATSQIEALCGIKRDLILAGIPDEDIGLIHGYAWQQERGCGACGPGTGYASEPATPDDREYPVLLLSHAKVQLGHTATYNDQPRSLLIWDESLLSTKAQAMAVKDIRRADLLCAAERPALAPFTKKVLSQVEAELVALSQDAARQPRLLTALLTPAEIDVARQEALGIGRRDKFELALAESVENMLSLIEKPVSVTTTGNGGTGDGFLRYEVTVADHLKNIAILDASHVIRDLTQADASIEDRTTDQMMNYKSYSEVTVRQVRLSTGKTTMAAGAEASLPAAREVQRVIEAAPAGECVLVFTFKAAKRYLERNLDKLGVDREARIPVDGVLRKRVEILTWGQETSRNDLLHCKHVVMAGVLRRNPLELAATLTGQQRPEDSPQRHSAATLARLTLSEMAHCVLQGMNRGCCRVMDAGGKAKAMTLTILVAGADGLYDLLKPVLPGIQWERAETKGKQQSKPQAQPRPVSRTAQAAHSIAEYLLGLAQSKVSVSAVSKALSITLGREATQNAVNGALVIALLGGQQWVRKDRSLVRE